MGLAGASQPLCPLRILPQQGKCGSACALILPAICRGSHETNTVITCPGKLLCEAAALRLQTILIRRDLESRIHILISW